MNDVPQHRHVIDPKWNTDPVPWAPAADATMVPRLHAASLEQCRPCQQALAGEAADSHETTAAVMIWTVVMMATLPPDLYARNKQRTARNRSFTTLLNRLGALTPTPEDFDGAVAVPMTREMDRSARLAVVEECARTIDLYCQYQAQAVFMRPATGGQQP